MSVQQAPGIGNHPPQISHLSRANDAKSKSGRFTLAAPLSHLNFDEKTTKNSSQNNRLTIARADKTIVRMANRGPEDKSTVITFSITSVVTDILNQYDHNRDGAINCKRPKGFLNQLFTPDERVRHTSSTVQTGAKAQLTIKTYTHRELFEAADKNRDGRVTRQELTAKIAEFDTNNDRQFTSRGLFGVFQRKPKMEWERFQDTMGERRV